MKKLLVWLVIIILVVGGGIFAYFEFSPIMKCGSLDGIEKTACYRNLASEKGDISICKKIQSEKDVQSCFMMVAEAKKDITICDNQITDIETKDYCYVALARINGDISICDNKLSTESLQMNACYYAVAQNKRDTSICDLTKDYYGGKYSWLSGNDESIGYCYRAIAIDSQDKSICDKITVQSIRAECLNSIA